MQPYKPTMFRFDNYVMDRETIDIIVLFLAMMRKSPKEYFLVGVQL